MSSLKASEHLNSPAVLSKPTTHPSSGSLQKTQFSLMLAAAALFGGEKPAAASLHREPPRETRVADFLKSPEGEANPPPVAEQLMAGRIFKEEQDEQRREVRNISDHYHKNRNKPGYEGIHLEAFKELSRQDNYPATRALLDAHLKGWYHDGPVNYAAAKEEIEWALKNTRMTIPQETRLRDLWRDVVKCMEKERELRRTTPETIPVAPKAAPPEQLRPQPPPIRELDEHFRNLELDHDRPKKQSRNNAPWRELSPNARIHQPA
ncbi:MAG: hypothetical protein HOO67_04560 [Candidatus Peribacteraceae bacterium]|nr:hypothetical protein [Candidatus Peribacteraceae bacterium]